MADPEYDRNLLERNHLESALWYCLFAKQKRKRRIESIKKACRADKSRDYPDNETSTLNRVKMHQPVTTTDQDHAYKRNAQRRDRIKVFIEFLTLIGVLGYGAVAYRQWQAMLSANAIGRENLGSVQRAFLYMTLPVHFHKAQLPASVGERFAIEYPWKNFGATPARDVITNFRVRLCNVATPIEQCPLVDNPRSVIVPAFSIPPQYSVIGGISFVPRDDIDLFLHRSVRIFAYGWAKYRDVFRETRPHLTEYCVEAVGSSGEIDSSDKPLDLVFMNCQRHNCSDEECPDYYAEMANYK